jgi:hypothetical protein
MSVTIVKAVEAGLDISALRHEIKNVAYVLKTVYRASHLKPELKKDCDTQFEESLKKLEAIAHRLELRKSE